MKFLLLLALIVSQAYAHENIFRTRADKFAFGKFTEQKHHPWPFPLLSIGHNMQSYQDYNGSPYWHDGLDVRGQPSQLVYTTATGKVVNIENYVTGSPLYWEIAIQDDEGFVWKYHHIAKESISQEILNSFKSGTRVEAGSVVGNIVKWPSVSFGEVYHHLHLLVVAADGQYINPFLMLEPLNDTQAPVINKIGLAVNHRPISGFEVIGDHAVYVEASDLIYHQKFILPPHRISYRLDNGAEKVVWIFVNLPSAKNDSDFINDFYMQGTCGNYSCRKFYINLNFSQATPRGTFNLPVGEHGIEVMVEDIVGNRASKSFKWKVL